MPKLNIAVIGAGPTGLCAAKSALAYGCDVTVFEQTSKIGGTWVYTDRSGEDEYGVPIHTSMYKGLRTNIPIESMGFPDFPFPSNGRSFVMHEEVLEFFESYAKHFKLADVIKFHHCVVRVRPVQSSRWEIIVKDAVQNSYETVTFDAVFVCNGHYNTPYFPDLKGKDLFKGKQIHSQTYRLPESFRDENVLIVGAGPSGRDILFEIAATAKHITLSHHRDLTKTGFPQNVTQKGDVKYLTESGAVFSDGTEDDFTAILYCTGYYFTFPFLSVDCGICIDDEFYVKPLFKHCLNIEHPTMAIIGLQICAYTLMYDLQARLCLKYWTNELKLPSNAEMVADTEIQMKKQWAKNVKQRHAHLLGVDQNDYFADITELAKVEKLPEVYFKLYDDCTQLRLDHPNDYREFNYKIVDDKTFTKSRLGENSNENSRKCI